MEGGTWVVKPYHGLVIYLSVHVGIQYSTGHKATLEEIKHIQIEFSATKVQYYINNTENIYLITASFSIFLSFLLRFFSPFFIPSIHYYFRSFLFLFPPFQFEDISTQPT